MEPNMILLLAGGLAVLGVLLAVVLVTKRTAYLGPVKEELQKEKMWLRRGEYNAAMVKGRQNLELLLKLVAEKNGIQLDNTAQAVANAKEESERRGRGGYGGRPNRGGRGKAKKVMTHQQFYRWLSENGYLDRVAKWEMNQVRIIGNKAVHENFADKDDAWNQYNYLEDILKTVTEKSQKTGKRQERKDGRQQQKEKQGKTAPQKQAQGKEAADVKSESADQQARKRRRKKKPQGSQNVQREKKVQVGQKTQGGKKPQSGQKAQDEKKPQGGPKTQSGKKPQSSQKVQSEKKAEGGRKSQSEKKPEDVKESQNELKVQNARKRRRRRKPQNKQSEPSGQPVPQQ